MGDWCAWCGFVESLWLLGLIWVFSCRLGGLMSSDLCCLVVLCLWVLGSLLLVICLYWLAWCCVY